MGLNLNRNSVSGIELQQKLLFLPYYSAQHLGAFKRNSFNLSDLDSNLQFQPHNLQNCKVEAAGQTPSDFKQLTHKLVKK